MREHLIKISKDDFKLLLWGPRRPHLSICLLLWKMRVDYYPWCTRDGSHYTNFLFLPHARCNSQNTCSRRLRLWQRMMRKLIFIKRNCFPLITATVSCGRVEDEKENASEGLRRLTPLSHNSGPGLRSRMFPTQTCILPAIRWRYVTDFLLILMLHLNAAWRRWLAQRDQPQ